MATIKPIFKLKDPTGENESLILMKIYFNRERFTYSTGKKILPNYWNKETERPYLKNDEPGLNEKLDKATLQRLNDLNFIINRFHNETERIFNYYTYQGITPTIKQIKREYDTVFNPEAIIEKEKMTLNKFISE